MYGYVYLNEAINKMPQKFHFQFQVLILELKCCLRIYVSFQTDVFCFIQTHMA